MPKTRARARGSSFISLSNSRIKGWLIQWRHFCAPDQKPKDYRQFPSRKDHRELVNKMPVRWQKEGGEGTGQIAGTCNEQQDAQEAGDETGSNAKNPTRQKPKPPQQFPTTKTLTTQSRT